MLNYLLLTLGNVLSAIVVGFLLSRKDTENFPTLDKKISTKKGFEFSPVVFPGFLRLPVPVLAGEHAAGIDRLLLEEVLSGARGHSGRCPDHEVRGRLREVFFLERQVRCEKSEGKVRDHGTGVAQG